MQRCELRTLPRRFALFVLLAAITIPLAAQSGAQPGPGRSDRTNNDEVFAPFVTRIRLSIRDPRVRVSWEDADDLLTTYRVYRSDEPITNETLNQAQLVARIEPGTEGFVDIPPTSGSYYYAVIAENPTGAPYRVVIPGRNASFRPVEIVSIATEEERAARIQGINATVVSAQGQSAIEITAVSDREGRTIALYRSTDPIASAADLANATLMREVPSGEIRLIDLPVPGVGYYYAAVDSQLLIADTVSITPGQNATIGATEIPLSTAADRTATRDAAGEAATETEPFTDAELADVPSFDPRVTSVRSVPLPYLQLQSQLATGLRLRDPRIIIPDRRAISSTTGADVQALLASLDGEEAPSVEPTILAVDRMPEPEGAEYTLRTILEGPFARLAWESALEQLGNYFSLPLSEDLAARAHFYRAQAYYFTGQRQRAILELLLARDRYYVDVEVWLDRILDSRGA